VMDIKSKVNHEVDSVPIDHIQNRRSVPESMHF
jgi:hypothetical protein